MDRAKKPPERQVEKHDDEQVDWRAEPYEPLLPIEKKLIAGSLILGVLLLVVLIWTSHMYFPTP
jgi:hypothetical protein